MLVEKKKKKNLRICHYLQFQLLSSYSSAFTGVSQVMAKVP